MTLLSTPALAAAFAAILPLMLFVIYSDMKTMRIPNKAVIAVFVVFLATASWGLPLDSFLWRLLAGVIAFFYGFLIALWNVVAISLRQRLTPDELRGRVASVARLLAWGTQPLGALLGGVVAAAFGLRAPFMFGAVIWALEFLAAVGIINNARIAAVEAEAGVSR